VQAAFQAKKGDQPRFVEVQGPEGSGSSYYAVSVEDILSPKPKPFEEVKDAVRADWTRDAIRHTQEEAAAKLLLAVKGGQSLADAATVAGLTVRQLPATGRSAPAEGVPAQLVTPLFTLKKGEPTMVETPDGFVVAVLADIQEPDPKADPVGYGQVRDALTKAIGDDIETVYVSAVRDRGNPRINRAAIDALARPAE
jgi:peptidyl-prolyl cis-trans isomerase D